VGFQGRGSAFLFPQEIAATSFPTRVRPVGVEAVTCCLPSSPPLHRHDPPEISIRSLEISIGPGEGSIFGSRYPSETNHPSDQASPIEPVASRVRTRWFERTPCPPKGIPHGSSSASEFLPRLLSTRLERGRVSGGRKGGPGGSLGEKAAQRRPEGPAHVLEWRWNEAQWRGWEAPIRRPRVLHGA